MKCSYNDLRFLFYFKMLSCLNFYFCCEIHVYGLNQWIFTWHHDLHLHFIVLIFWYKVWLAFCFLWINKNTINLIFYLCIMWLKNKTLSSYADFLSFKRGASATTRTEILGIFPQKSLLSKQKHTYYKICLNFFCICWFLKNYKYLYKKIHCVIKFHSACTIKLIERDWA